MSEDWIYGKHAVQEALRADRDIEKILIAEGVRKIILQEILSQVREKKIPFSWVPKSKLDLLSMRQNHQGIMAQVSAFQYTSFSEMLSQVKKLDKYPLFVILAGIEDPHNLGSIIRSANGAGVDGVIIPKRRAVGLTATVAKTSAGAIEYVPIAKVTNLNRTIDELKAADIWIVGSDSEATQTYVEPDYKMPIALVIGNEGQGIPPVTKQRCDIMVKIPMLGQVQSLNASVAASLLLYQISCNRGYFNSVTKI